MKGDSRITMPAGVVTQLISEQPVMVCISRDTPIFRMLSPLFQSAGFTVERVSPEDFAQLSGIQQKEVYKIVWLCSVDQWRNQEYLHVCSALRSLTHPVMVVFSVYTPIIGEDGSFSEWKTVVKLQRQVLVDCNYYLPTAAFIFLQDLATPGAHSIFSLLTEIQANQLIHPGVDVYPMSVQEGVRALQVHLFRPYGHMSVLIRGKRWKTIDIAREIANQYEAYFGDRLHLNLAQQQQDDVVPFSVSIQEVAQAVDELTQFVRTLPRVNQGEHRQPQQLPAPVEHMSVREVQKPPRSTLKARVSELPTAEPKIKSPTLSDQKQTSEGKYEDSSQPTLGEQCIQVQDSRPKDVQSDPKQIPQVVRDPLDVHQELQKIFQSSRQEHKQSYVQGLVNTHLSFRKKTKRRKALFWGGVGFIGVALGVCFLVLGFMLNTFLLKQELVQVVQGVGSQQDDSKVEHEREEFLRNLLDFQVSSYGAILSLPPIEYGSRLVEIGERLHAFQEQSQEVVDYRVGLFQHVAQLDQLSSVQETLSSLGVHASSAYEHLAHLQSLPLPPDIETHWADLDSHFTEWEQSLIAQQQLQVALPKLLGTRTYAVVLQNEQELRPTGGFIQSVALITLNQGQIVDVAYMSGYEVDENVLGAVIPPADLQRFLPEDQLHFVDSNWNPHYPATAQQMQWYLQRASNQEIAGVLSVNLGFLKQVLAAIGPVELPEYNEVLTHQNLAERMEFHSEVVLVDSGSVADYSTLVFERVIEKVRALSPEKASLFLRALNASFLAKHGLYYDTDEVVQSVIHTLGWSGALFQPQCPAQFAQQNCLVEAVAQIEANVGINKANYHLTTHTTHAIALDKSFVRHQRVSTYQNTAQSNAWPKGSYKSYVRYYIPQNATDVRIRIGMQDVPPEELIFQQEQGRQTVGVYLEVPIAQERQLSLEFSTPLPYSSSFAYAFFNQLQPGNTQQEVDVRVTPGNHLRTEVIAPKASLSSEGYLFSSEQDHLFLGFQFE